MTAFEQATAFEPVAPGRFVGSVDGGWSTPAGPNGGYVAAIAVRALERGANGDGSRRLRTITCHFLRAPALGELSCDVEVLRVGRRFATARLTAHQAGVPVLAALATYGSPDLDAVRSWTAPMPAVAPAPSWEAGSAAPEDYRSEDGLWVAAPENGATLLDKLRMAPREGRGPFASAPLPPEGPWTGGWLALAEPQPIDAAYAVLCCDAWWPPAFEVLPAPAIMSTLELTVHVRAEIPPEGLPFQPLLGRYGSPTAAGGLIDEEARLFLADGTVLASARQLALFAPFTP